MIPNIKINPKKYPRFQTYTHTPARLKRRAEGRPRLSPRPTKDFVPYHRRVDHKLWSFSLLHLALPCTQGRAGVDWARRAG